MLQLIFVSLVIGAWSNIWVHSICGPDGMFSGLRVWWYNHAFENNGPVRSYSEDPPITFKSRLFSALWKPLFGCHICNAGWTAILFYSFSQMAPESIFCAMVLSMLFSNIVNKYAEFS